MSAILANYGLELIFGLISAGALWFCRHLWKQNKELERLQKEEENRKYRQMIIDEIEPIIEELGRAEEEIKAKETMVVKERQNVNEELDYIIKMENKLSKKLTEIFKAAKLTPASKNGKVLITAKHVHEVLLATKKIKQLHLKKVHLLYLVLL